MLVKYAFLADAVTLDQAGKLTAVGIFDIVIAPKFPMVHRDMTLVVQMEGNASEKGGHKITVELRDEKQNRMAAFDQQVVLNPDMFRANLLVKIQDVVFPRPGRYEFVVFGNDRFLVRTTLVAKKIHVQEAGVA